MEFSSAYATAETVYAETYVGGNKKLTKMLQFEIKIV